MTTRQESARIEEALRTAEVISVEPLPGSRSREVHTDCAPETPANQVVGNIGLYYAATDSRNEDGT
jgi:hypothetical protein